MASSAISIPRKKDQLGSASPGSPGSSSSQASSPASSENSGSSPSSSTPLFHHRRRPSFLSSSVSRVEHSVFDLGIRDGSPRLITCVKASQGFDWNLDIFLPSHCDFNIPNLTDKMEPVHEIILTEEEYANMLPSWGSSWKYCDRYLDGYRDSQQIILQMALHRVWPTAGASRPFSLRAPSLPLHRVLLTLALCYSNGFFWNFVSWGFFLISPCTAHSSLYLSLYNLNDRNMGKASDIASYLC